MDGFASALRSCFSDILDAVVAELEIQRRQNEKLSLRLSKALDMVKMYQKALENCDNMLRAQQQINEQLEKEARAVDL
ncbi:hypothetical protein TWF594_007853 [Orbilia oligospora]|uniref:Uncharacterized protein n=1 Tax=Orbilia oligospora TaxID=2813651 RepID=A0A7C8P212_ORBOL|nr:hypothetical protein TWF706_002541 [Orbilia oligospora]KAF3136591.1 hypothetical protein TWF594_007853 [Orbilia oligospora]KAF3147194.1 hypothetical protein TWF703_000034 [Orbilia oligospora]